MPTLATLTAYGRDAFRSRVLVRHPGFSFAVILSLGVGISAAAGVFAVVESVRHARLPFANAERLEHLYMTRPSSPRSPELFVPAAVVRGLQGPDSPVEQLAVYLGGYQRVRDRERDASVWGVQVTENFAHVLGVHSVVGRLIDSTDVSPAAMLAYDYWQSEFGGDSAVVGRTIEVNGLAHSIVGVMARECSFPEGTSLWTSGLRAETYAGRRVGVSIVALLRTGATPDEVRPKLVGLGMAAITAAAAHPSSARLHSMSFRDYLVTGRMTGVILPLTIIAVLVGFMTAVNFAALTLARGIRRRAEIGVRAALGASVGRLAQLIVSESLLLCAAGGVLAAILAPAALALLRTSFGRLLPAWLEITFGWRTVVASIALSMAMGVVFGLGPALDIARPALMGFLRAASSTVSDGGGLARTRSWLVGIQVALATAVLVALGGLLGHAVVLSEPQPGFGYAAVIRGFVRDTGRADAAQSARMNQALLEARQTPGVSAAAFLDRQYVGVRAVRAEGAVASSLASEDDPRLFWIHRVGDQFFGVMRPRVIAGRLPTDEEMVRGDAVTVVTRPVAHEFFGDRAVGKWIRPTGPTGRSFTVVGVVDDIKEHVYQNPAPPLVFIPLASPTDAAGVAGSRELWVRSAAPVEPTLRTLRLQMAAGRIAGVEVSRIEAMTTIQRRELEQFHRASRIILSIFAVALGLAALGIYGLVAYTAEMRSRELAIREALGATRWQVTGRVLQGAAIQATVGVAAGAVLATGIFGYLNRYQLKLGSAAGATGVAFAIVAITVLISSIGPLRAAWKRDLSFALRTGG